MADIQKKGTAYYCTFRHQNRRHTFSIGKVTEKEALAKVAQVDYLLMRLKQGLIQLPKGCEIVTFILHDGQPPEAATEEMTETVTEDHQKSVTIGRLRELYLAAHANGTVEQNTQETTLLAEADS